MADFPVGGYSFSEAGGVDAAASTGTTVTSGSGSKGSWVELIASTAESSTLLLIAFQFNSGAIRDFIFDVGIGSVGNEEIIVSDMQNQLKAGFNNATYYHIPINIAKSTRVSVRIQTNSSSDVADFVAYFFRSTFQSNTGYAKTTAYGLSGADGTSVDPGGSANTKGSWIELEASTSDQINAFTITIASNTNSTQSDAQFLFDVAVGSSGNEVAILENLFFGSSGFESNRPNIYIEQKINKGSRISIRMQSSITDANDRIQSFTVNGVS